MPTRRQLANAIRALSMDAVQKANSGHPGMPMGMADIAQVLWADHLKHNPGNPAWADRDRFVLSNGHGSMLLYSLLHLTGYPLDIEQLKNFRQFGAHTAGHPEVEPQLGIETTTGPLGQGVANAVGMALAEKILAATFNRPGHEVVNHHTWVFLGDGCLMEGVSHEACSLAGTLGLSKLVVLYDDNGISIDGHVDGWFRDDTPRRFEAYGWNVIRGVDGHDAEAVDRAVRAATGSDRPTLVCCRTVIGKGAPNKAGTHDVHGAPLGAQELAELRAALGWPHPPFEIPAGIAAAWDARPRGAALEADWQKRFDAYAAKHPELAAEFMRVTSRELPAQWRETVGALYDKAGAATTRATRKASQDVLDDLVAAMPELFGGSADLTWSNLTFAKGSQPIDGSARGNYAHYGVREFGMAAAMNGMALHAGLVPYGGTFLVFSDYMRNAIRMSALMRQRVVYVLTHDSIGLGEDGPTHQPVEHAAALRMIPNVDVWRPCDPLETAAAWVAGIERTDGPTCLLLSRQNLPIPPRPEHAVEGMRRGGYVLAEAASGTPAAVVVATGSEVGLALDAQAKLRERGIDVRVVSMPSTSVFDRQPAEWRDRVLPPGLPSASIEAGVTGLWRQYVGRDGLAIGIDRFGESAPAGALFDYFGLTADKIATRIADWLAARR